MTSERLNPAERGKALADAYLALLGEQEYEGEDIETMLQDLVADVLHYADYMQAGAQKIVDMALIHFEDESDADEAQVGHHRLAAIQNLQASAEMIPFCPCPNDYLERHQQHQPTCKYATKNEGK